MARFKQSARQQLQREQETRRDLSQLIDLLKETARDCASDEGLTKDQRDLWIRQGDIFSASVAELRAILEDHRYEHAREHRLYKLFEALGSACFIAARVEDPTWNRLKTAPATDKKRAVTKIVIEEAEKTKIWREHPDCSRSLIAGQIEKLVNERIKAEVQLSRREKKLIAEGRPVLSRRAIETCLNRWLSTTHGDAELLGDIS